MADNADDEDDEKPISQELAEDRTNWAEDRTVLANERTFAGWMRTGLAAVGVGLGFRAVFRATDQIMLAKAASIGFIAIGIAIFFLAWRSSCRLHQRLDSHAAQPLPRSHLGVVALALSVGSAVLGVIIVYL
ncbi:DUF202 domain-containing protein [Tepidamorphus sp. 3E244]|uniref:DUF202 domain-containing protein n=1 Tax=Tepidamorphus sp. 3E244 TaxID=3385498 RepID=UPI0038FCF87E